MQKAQKPKDLIPPEQVVELADQIGEYLKAHSRSHLGFTLQVFEYGDRPRSQMISTTLPEVAIAMLRKQMGA